MKCSRFCGAISSGAISGLHLNTRPGLICMRDTVRARILHFTSPCVSAGCLLLMWQLLIALLSLCRLQSCVAGADCDAECDDQLQHLISVHIRSRYSTDLSVDGNDPEFRHLGPEHHRPASYMHYALHKWHTKFRKARGLSTS